MKVVAFKENSRKRISVRTIYDVIALSYPKGMEKEAKEFLLNVIDEINVHEVPKFDLVLLGSPVEVLEKYGSPEFFTSDEKIVIKGRSREDRLKTLEKLLIKILRGELMKIFEEIRERGFKVPQELRVTRGINRIASLRPPRMSISLFSASLDVTGLKTIVAHEIAHFYTRGHGEKFFKRMRSIFPEMSGAGDVIERFRMNFAMSWKLLEVWSDRPLWICL